MGLKGLLLGHEVKVYYDRHLTKTEKAEDAENPSEYEILKGVVNGVYKDMILISYSYREFSAERCPVQETGRQGQSAK